MSQDTSLQVLTRLLYLDGKADVEELGATDTRQAGRLAADVDLIAIISGNLGLWQPAAGDWVLSPWSLRMVLDFSPGETWKEVLQRVHQENAMQRISRSGMTYHISHRREDFDLIYHGMYIPWVKRLYADSAVIFPEAEANRCFMEHGSLIVEDANGLLVAGGIETRQHQVLYAQLYGVLDGRQELIEKGALDAWFYFEMKRAFEMGFKRFDFGQCLPFIQDEEYLQKKKWGGFQVTDSWQPGEVLFWAPSSSSAALDWMKAYPIQPQFARYGGQTIRPFYDELKQSMAAVENQQPQISPQAAAAEPDPIEYRFETYNQGPPEMRQSIAEGLYQHNIEVLGAEIESTIMPINISIRDQKEQIIGGLLGSFFFGCLHIDTLWVSDDHRGHDLGTRLLQMAENAARSRGTRVITLETTSFQAIHFYPKFGYEVIAQIEDIPVGHTLYYLKKVL